MQAEEFHRVRRRKCHIESVQRVAKKLHGRQTKRIPLNGYAVVHVLVLQHIQCNIVSNPAAEDTRYRDVLRVPLTSSSPLHLAMPAVF